VKKNRPVNLNLSTVQFPITAIVSILHRISGMILLPGVLLLLWMLDMSLASQASFDTLSEWLGNPLLKVALWAILAALAYHFVAGIRHIIMDLGFAESFESGKLTAYISLVCTAILVLLAGVWVW